MRLNMIFQLAEPQLDIEYRRSFLSLLKYAFQQASTNVYNTFYNNGNHMKPFTFSVYLPNPRFAGNTIQLSSNEISLNFTTYYRELGVYFYNSLTKHRFNPYPLQNRNSLTLKTVRLIKEQKITADEAVFKTLSPFLVRMHHKTDNEDEYLTKGSELFKSQIEANMAYTLKQLTGKEGVVEFTPVKIGDPIPIKHFGGFMEANKGIFKLTGKPETLDFIYKTGLGSRRSEGFGMLELLG